MIADPAFYYNASVAISRLKLSSWVEPFAGCTTVFVSFRSISMDNQVLGLAVGF